MTLLLLIVRDHVEQFTSIQHRDSSGTNMLRQINVCFHVLSSSYPIRLTNAIFATLITAERVASIV